MGQRGGRVAGDAGSAPRFASNANDAVSADDAEEQKNPHRMQHSEASLGNAVDGCGDDIGQHQGSDRGITAKGGNGAPVAHNQNQRD